MKAELRTTQNEPLNPPVTIDVPDVFGYPQLVAWDSRFFVFSSIPTYKSPKAIYCESDGVFVVNEPNFSNAGRP